MMTKKRKLNKTLVYILLVFLTFVMIIPFAWMVATSLKLPSEVNTWPPSWKTSSFASKRELPVDVSAGQSTSVVGISLREALSFVSKKMEGLSLTVNSDPIIRGTLTIPLKGVKYSNNMDISEFESFLNSLDYKGNFKTSEPELFFEEVFQFYKTGTTPYLKRDNFFERLFGKLEFFKEYIDTVSTFGVDRISDESEKERFESFLISNIEKIEKIQSKLEPYKAGLELVLSDKEVSEINNTLALLNDLRYDYENELSYDYNENVEGLIEIYRDVELYVKTSKFFKEIQNSVVSEDIIVKSITEKEKRENLLKELEGIKDYKLFEAVVNKTPIEKIVEEFSKALDYEIIDKYKLQTSDAVSLKTLVGSLLNVMYQNNVEPENYLNKPFDDVIEALDKLVGFNLTYSSVKGKLLAYKEDYEENFDSLFDDLLNVNLELQKVRDMFDKAVYFWKIVKAPDFVNRVMIKGGKNIQIELDNVSPVYFVDDNLSKVQLNFTPSEAFKNIFQNYVDAWNAAPFGRYYYNTVLVAVLTTILELVISALAAYAFSWMNFPGKGILFSIFLATMMVPGEVLLVPNFITVSKFGWIDTYYALIIPWIVSVFSIFLMRQHFLSLPSELFDAAKIDGCSHWRFLWQIVAPLSKPVMITTALLKFVGSWNAFLWVLIVTNNPKYRTLSVGLQAFSSEVGTRYNQLMAAATFSILPVILIFLFTQKYFVKGIARTGLK